MTATWYAKKNGIPLERVESHVEHDDTRERRGTYVLKVRFAFYGPLSAEQRAKPYDVVAHCPIHKLMTTSDVQVETATIWGSSGNHAKNYSNGGPTALVARA